MKGKFLKFWGTRGSCPVSGPGYKRYGGNTCCLEVCYGDSHLVIDAGTGIRPLGEILSRKKIDLFFGHTHWDHIIGLPFFDPLYQAGVEIIIWSPESEKSCKEIFRSIFSSELFPVSFEEIYARIDFRTTHPKTPVSLGELSIDFHATHHPGGAFCFKIKTPRQTIGYVTDNEIFRGYHGSPEIVPAEIVEPSLSLIDFLSECDLLIHEAQYSAEEYLDKEGWGHSSIENTALLIEKTKISNWLVTHHDPKHEDRKLNLAAKQAKKFLRQRRIPCSVKWIADEEEMVLM